MSQLFRSQLSIDVGIGPQTLPWTIDLKNTGKSEELDTFIRQCSSGIQLLDIGARYGFFALAALRYGGSLSRVLCVEASPNATSILQSTINLNQSGDQIEVINVAFGDRDGVLPMLTTGPIAGAYFIVPTEERDDTTLVPQKTLASILQETGFQPTHIKIDNESYEYEVIDAAKEALEKLHPVILLELHGDALQARKKNPADVIDMLRSAGYDSFELAGRAIGLEDMFATGFNCRITCTKRK